MLSIDISAANFSAAVWGELLAPSSVLGLVDLCWGWSNHRASVHFAALFVAPVALAPVRLCVLFSQFGWVAVGS